MAEVEVNEQEIETDEVNYRGDDNEQLDPSWWRRRDRRDELQCRDVEHVRVLALGKRRRRQKRIRPTRSKSTT